MLAAAIEKMLSLFTLSSARSGKEIFSLAAGVAAALATYEEVEKIREKYRHCGW
jgi:hypothetical protein